jgi:hypothetical protein
MTTTLSRLGKHQSETEEETKDEGQDGRGPKGKTKARRRESEMDGADGASIARVPAPEKQGLTR